MQGCGRPRGFSGQHRNSQEQRQHGESMRILRPRMSSSVKEGCNRNFRTGVREAWKAAALLWVLPMVSGVWQAVAVYQSARVLLQEKAWHLPAWGWGLP